MAPSTISTLRLRSTRAVCHVDHLGVGQPSCVLVRHRHHNANISAHHRYGHRYRMVRRMVTAAPALREGWRPMSPMPELAD